jgi:hypothetical protein
MAIEDPPPPKIPQFPDLKPRDGFSITNISRETGEIQIKELCLDPDNNQEGVWMHIQLSNNQSGWLNIREGYVGTGSRGTFDGTTNTLALTFVEEPGVTKTYSHYHTHNANFLPTNSDPLGIKQLVEDEISELDQIADRDLYRARKTNFYVAVKFFLPSPGDLQEYIKYVEVAHRMRSISFNYVIVTPFGKVVIRFEDKEHNLSELIVKYNNALSTLVETIISRGAGLSAFDNLTMLGSEVIKFVNEAMLGDLQVEFIEY